MPATANVSQNGTQRSLAVLADTIRLAARVVAEDPTLLPGQLLARIDPVRHPGLAALIAGVRAPRAFWLRPACPSLVQRERGSRQILSGHNNSVQALASTGAGRFLVSGSWDRTVRLWDRADGRLLRVFTGHDGYVEAVCTTPDGRLAVSGSVDGTVRLWDLRVMSAAGSWDVGEPVVALAMHPDGRQLAVASPSRLSLLDVDLRERVTLVCGHESSPEGAQLLREALNVAGRNSLGILPLLGKEAAELKFAAAGFVTVQFSPDGCTLFAGRADGRLGSWDLHGRQLREWTAHTGPVWAVVPMPDGTGVVTGGQDGAVRRWEVPAGDLRWESRRRTAAPRTMSDLPTRMVPAVAVTPDGATVIAGHAASSMSGSDAEDVSVWEASTGASRGVLKGHSAGIFSVAALPDGDFVASGSEDRTIRLWALPTSARSNASTPVVLAGHTEGVMCVARLTTHQPRDRLGSMVDRVVSGSQDGTLRTWDLETASSSSLRGHTKWVLGVAVTPDGRTILSAGDQTLRFWDASTGDLIETRMAHAAGASCVAVSADGTRALSGGYDRKLALWDVVRRRLRVRIDAPSRVLAVAFAPDSRRALAGTEDGTVLLLDVDLAEAHPRRPQPSVKQLGPKQAGWVKAVAVTRDGTRAVFGGEDGRTTVADLGTGRVERILDGRHGGVGAILELADGSLATTHVDGTVVVWDVHSGTATTTVRPHDGPVGAIALLGDGRIVTGSGDATVCVFDPTRLPRYVTPSHSGAVTGLVMDSEGTTVVSASDDRTLRMWDARTGANLGVIGATAGPILSLDMMADRTLVTASADARLTVWDPMRRESLRSRELPWTAEAVRMAADGRHLVAIHGGRVAIIDVATLRPNRKLAPQGDELALALALTEEGSILLLGIDASIRVLDLATGSTQRRLTGPPGHEGFLLLGPIASQHRGRLVASPAVQLNDEHMHDNPIRVWDLVTGLLVHELRGHTDWVRGLGFSGSDRLVSAGQDGAVIVWDLTTGTALARFVADSRLQTVAAGASGSRVVAGGSDGSLHFLDLEHG